jgi:ectoine hydroxylase-related dioxygenase (phytanoyl-CoA dioxygenase family)
MMGKVHTVLEILPHTFMSTSPSEIAKSYNENGYYLAKGVYSPAEVAELERDFDRIVAQLRSSGENVDARWKGAAIDKIDANTTVVHTHNVQIYSSAWLRAFLQPRFIEASQAILGSPDVILHHSKLFQKPAEKGAPFPMHQDWSYFPSVNDSMMAGIIHVSAATDEMGCLRVYPGSHRLGRKAESNGQSESEDNWLKDYPIEKATVVEAEPGDVVFFHYFTLHGSMPNRSNKVRKTVLVQMYRGDDRIEDGNGHINTKLTLAGWNHQAKRSNATIS